MKHSPALRIECVSVRLDRWQVVSGLSLHVGRGELVGLVGPNGAGKSTLLDAICGFVPYDGSVLLDGEPLDRLGPRQRARRGLARTYQRGELFDNLDVQSHIEVALRTDESVDALLTRFGLAEVKTMRSAALNQAQRQSLAWARAEAIGAKVLLLDEPMAGLGTAQREEALWRLRDLRRRGISALVVDHDIESLSEVCDSLAVMELGRVVAFRSPLTAGDEPPGMGSTATVPPADHGERTRG